eukprot:10431941-Alexandrium_andersonii.AAC.1
MVQGLLPSVLLVNLHSSPAAVRARAPVTHHPIDVARAVCLDAWASMRASKRVKSCGSASSCFCAMQVMHHV